LVVAAVVVVGDDWRVVARTNLSPAGPIFGPACFSQSGLNRLQVWVDSSGMDATQTVSSPRRRNLFLNLAVAANAVLLGVLVVGQGGPSPRGLEASALASPPAVNEESDPTSRVNPADQRKQIISELQSINQRLSAMDAVLKKGINVRVTEMPKQDNSDKK